MSTQLGYYSTFQLPRWFKGPDAVVNSLRKIWNYHYKELYEENGGNFLLEDVIEEVLNLFCIDQSLNYHKRLVYMGWAMALGAKPTIDALSPRDERPSKVLQMIQAWVSDAKVPSLPTRLFSELSEAGYPQALSEALLVFQNLNQAIHAEEAKSCVREIVDDCLTGYAIFPGSAGRRDLFNWWLIEITPASYSLRLPESIYTKDWPWPPICEKS